MKNQKKPSKPMAYQGTKREVHPILRKILDVDKIITNQFVTSVSELLPQRKYSKYYKLLEISCHGIPWFTGWFLFIYVVNVSALYHTQFNMLLGLFLDVILIAIIKSIARRRRPISNSSDFGPDHFSFPSGHASRAFFIAYFFTHLFPLGNFITPFIYIWASCVAFSRLLARRHYILDIVAGVLLGLAEGVLLGWLWCGQGISASMISWISDVNAEPDDLSL